jgi:hypothetical protein
LVCFARHNACSISGGASKPDLILMLNRPLDTIVIHRYTTLMANYNKHMNTTNKEIKRLTILSLGAGVQSTTMALMAEHGEIDKPDYAIFADTQWEPDHVYKHLEWLRTKLTYPVHIVTGGNIRQDLINGVNSTGHVFASVPFHTINPDGTKGMSRRQCTNEYKLRPIRKEVSRLVEYHGLKKRASIVTMMIGISLDEVVRMKPSNVKYIKHVFPLVDLRMNRNACKKWMKDNGYPEPPRSACIGCPYHSNYEWREMKLNDSKSWEDAVKVDTAIREHSNYKKFGGSVYLHKTAVPLIDADLRNDHEKGQPDLFNNECEGMCGV